VRHLLSIEDLDRAGIERILDRARSFTEVSEREVKKVPALRGRRVLILFYEASTRTRSSFELAAKTLSAEVINFSAGGSSVEKGESLKDTVQTLSAYGPDLIVVRTPHVGAARLVAEWSTAAVVNGGDGKHEHPTQALLDVYTLRERLGSLDGAKIWIVGDVMHSRVARSNVWALTAAGADLWLCGPSTLLRGFDAWAVAFAAAGRAFRVTTSLDEALRDADVVMTLRIQRERMAAGLLPSLREYAARYGITRERLSLARPDALVMHPGPMNEGVEIAPDVAAGSQSVITDQVTNGVAVRMAVLQLLAGARS
jgi:aspartate carbamoyltransferase catalytic subunit